jgi:hypothetical protein
MTQTSVLWMPKRLLVGLVLAAAVVLPHPDATAGQAPVNLGSASRFAVLAASEIASVPTDALTGDVGLSPAARSKITGLTAVEVVGTIFAADDSGAVAAMLTQAQGDLGAAFINAGPVARPNGVDVSIFGGGAAELGGRTLAPGLYKSAPGSYDITSLDLTLDAGGDPSAVWIFQMAATLNILNYRQVILAGGAQPRNVFWQVGTSATLSTYSVCQGTIMAAQSIVLQTGATLQGRALAQNGAVTLDANTLTIPNSITSAVLQSAALVTGPFTDAPGQSVNLATQTITVPLSGSRQFYRIRSTTALTVTKITISGANVVLNYN